MLSHSWMTKSIHLLSCSFSSLREYFKPALFSLSQWVVFLGLQPRMYYFKYPIDGPNRDGCWVQGHPEVVAGNQSGSRIVNHAIAIVKRAPKDYLFPLQSRRHQRTAQEPWLTRLYQLPGRPRTTHIKTSTLRYLQKVARKFDGFQTLNVLSLIYRISLPTYTSEYYWAIPYMIETWVWHLALKTTSLWTTEHILSVSQRTLGLDDNGAKAWSKPISRIRGNF